MQSFCTCSQRRKRPVHVTQGLRRHCRVEDGVKLVRAQPRRECDKRAAERDDVALRDALLLSKRLASEQRVLMEHRRRSTTSHVVGSCAEGSAPQPEAMAPDAEAMRQFPGFSDVH